MPRSDPASTPIGIMFRVSPAFVDTLVGAEMVDVVAATSMVRLPANVGPRKVALVATVSFWPRVRRGRRRSANALNDACIPVVTLEALKSGRSKRYSLALRTAGLAVAGLLLLLMSRQTCGLIAFGILQMLPYSVGYQVSGAQNLQPHYHLSGLAELKDQLTVVGLIMIYDATR
jgi:hypothetical protein